MSLSLPLFDASSALISGAGVGFLAMVFPDKIYLNLEILRTKTAFRVE
jgi:hypothetical protein